MTLLDTALAVFTAANAFFVLLLAVAGDPWAVVNVAGALMSGGALASRRR